MTQGPEQQKAAAGGRTRLDGISTMSGTITWGSSSVSVTLDVTGGSTDNTAGYRMAGANGTSVPENATYQDATRNGSRFTASGLPVATGGRYTVKFNYTLNGAARSVSGTTASSGTSGTTSVTLS